MCILRCFNQFRSHGIELESIKGSLDYKPTKLAELGDIATQLNFFTQPSYRAFGERLTNPLFLAKQGVKAPCPSHDFFAERARRDSAAGNTFGFALEPAITIRTGI